MTKEIYVIVCNRKVPVRLKTDAVMKQDYALFTDEDESIWVKKSLSISMRRRTLAHEAFHAFLHFTGYNHLLQDISENMEESLVRAFESGLGDQMSFPQTAEDWIAGKGEKR